MTDYLDDREARRIEVDELLRAGADLKLIRDLTDEARGKIEKAYDLASLEPRIPGPWKGLAAYRLAHFILRTESDRKSLEDADELLLEASREWSLGPWPQLYRLPILHRLQQSGKSIRTAVDEARRHVEHWSVPGKLFANEGDRDSERLRMQLQEGVLNFLELAMYFLGSDYTPIDGLGGKFHDSYFIKEWFLVGPDPMIARVSLSRDMAYSELEDRSEDYPDAILFRFPESPERPTLGHPGRSWQKIGRGSARLLSWLLKGEVRSFERLQETVVGDEGAGSNFQQIKNRTIKALAELTGRSRWEILIDDPDTGLPKLAPGLLVFGMVHKHTYNFPVRR